ncbi:hypothetical protein B6I21_01450 [candidate division KSB1 bacterium 4572_119]|nr:MAG: hypothetical protein B6I21_01450 [candidate division KSB1 bacterium 4572_119]
MTDRYKPLVLNISRSKQKKTFVVPKGGHFSVGQNGNNDLILYGTEYPKRHTLFYQKNGNYLINVKPFINGEIKLDSSTLQIGELVKHDILPQQGDSYLIKLSQNKQGFVTVGDTRIDFSFQYIERKIPVVVKTPVYSWTRATFKNLGSDILFKLIFLLLFSANALLIYSFKDYKVNIKKEIDLEKMPERLAKFIAKPPEELLAEESSSTSSNMETGETTEKTTKDKNKSSGNKSSNNRTRRGSRRGNPAASSGLLGLIGGTGTNEKSSSIVDALVDKGLVADLESILGGGSNLKVGKNGNKDKTDPLDQLIGTGGSGGIDDWLTDMEEDVPQVALKKRAKVDLIKPQKVTGSTEALGYRSEQSIMNVVLSRRGRIEYLYEKYLKRNPNLRGKISIEFTIAANGFVTNAKIIDSSINHPQLQRELLSFVRRLKFDAIPSGSVTTVFPFQFSKVN